VNVLVNLIRVNGQISRPKVVVDSDAGIDDAFALAMLLAADKRQEIEIIAITTVLGNTGVRNVSRNVLKILQTSDRLDVSDFSQRIQHTK
jgi:inosine-uridine nucleoside N-ribohydrolase